MCEDGCTCSNCRWAHRRSFIYMIIFTLFVYFLTKDVKLTGAVLLAHALLFHFM